MLSSAMMRAYAASRKAAAETAATGEAFDLG
jgi:hypothetical protein